LQGSNPVFEFKFHLFCSQETGFDGSESDERPVKPKPVNLISAGDGVRAIGDKSQYYQSKTIFIDFKPHK
jgi:hypothetical protein